LERGTNAILGAMRWAVETLEWRETMRSLPVAGLSDEP